MADVFISYHEESAGELAEQIADALDNAGISAWCARRDLMHGDFAQIIPRQIDICEIFLLLLNENACQSRHIESELNIAFNRLNRGEKIVILPLRMGVFQQEDWMRYYLGNIQIKPLPTRTNKYDIRKLVKRVAETLEHPDKIIKRGKCGKNVNFTLDENGILTISGKGSMWDFEWGSKEKRVSWWDKRKTISRVEIQNGVTMIGKYAFHTCEGLRSVLIFNTVTEIGAYAFAHCARLKSVVIPNSVTEVGAGAFQSCMSLTSVSVPANAYIADDAFPDYVRVTRRE